MLCPSPMLPDSVSSSASILLGFLVPALCLPWASVSHSVKWGQTGRTTRALSAWTLGSHLEAPAASAKLMICALSLPRIPVLFGPLGEAPE